MVNNAIPRYMGAPTSVLWTNTRPCGRHNVIFCSSAARNISVLSRKAREGGDMIGNIEHGCSELIERCRYVTGGMKFDLVPLCSS